MVLRPANQTSQGLSEKAKHLLALLVNCGLNQTTISYTQAAMTIGTPTKGNALGKVIGRLLAEVNEWCLFRGWPLLGTLVIRTSGNTAGYPGDGYYQLVQNLGIYRPVNDSLTERKSWTDSYFQRVWDYFGAGGLYPV